MEVKIGVQNVGRELVLESTLTPDELVKKVTAALGGGGSGGLLDLSDDKGRRVMVPTDKIAYLEVGPASERRVGFSAI